ncbi:MAG: hypothetical protein ACTHK0_09205 [Ginsengibacter sp.]
MENNYQAYTKEIDGKVFYFVKKFSSFPEFENFPQVLDSMGMHTDFYKACNIAKVYDEIVIHKLMNDLHILPESARVIHLHRVKAVTHSIIKNTHHALMKLRLATVN